MPLVLVMGGRCMLTFAVAASFLLYLVLRSTCEDLHEHSNGRSHRKEIPPLRSRNDGNEGVHLPGGLDRVVSYGVAWVGQCLSRTKGRNDDCGDVPGRSHWDGAASFDERLAAGRKHCANRWVDRRVGGSGRYLHDPRLCDGRTLAGPHARSILEIGCADDDWWDSRNFVR